MTHAQVAKAPDFVGKKSMKVSDFNPKSKNHKGAKVIA